MKNHEKLKITTSFFHDKSWSIRLSKIQMREVTVHGSNFAANWQNSAILGPRWVVIEICTNFRLDQLNPEVVLLPLFIQNCHSWVDSSDKQSCDHCNTWVTWDMILITLSIPSSMTLRPQISGQIDMNLKGGIYQIVSRSIVSHTGHLGWEEYPNTGLC